MEEFWLLPFLLFLVWLWVDGTRAREVAMTSARRACARHDVQLLDETVVLTRLRLGRGSDGRVGVRRRYHFEFTRVGDDRSSGEVELLGRQVTAMRLDLGQFTLHDLGSGDAQPPSHLH